MESVKDLPKNEQEFYLDKKDKVKYNKLCNECARECKQSWRSEIMACDRIPAKSKRLYQNRIKEQNKTIKQVADEIDMHTGTLKSLLTNEDRDIDYETHKKLMKNLYNQDIKDK